MAATKETYLGDQKYWVDGTAIPFIKSQSLAVTNGQMYWVNGTALGQLDAVANLSATKARSFGIFIYAV